MLLWTRYFCYLVVVVHLLVMKVSVACKSVWADIGGISAGEICLNSSSRKWICTELGCNDTTSVHGLAYKEGKYLLKFVHGQIDSGKCEQVHGVAVILHELDNIAHEMRDALFISKALIKHNVSLILGKETFSSKRQYRDHHLKTRLHYEGVIRAIVSGSLQRIPPKVILNENDIRKYFYSRDCMCLHNAVQKYSVGITYGKAEGTTARAISLYRESVLKECSITPEVKHILLITRKVGVSSRAWKSSVLHRLKNLITQHFDLPIVEFNPGTADLCVQVEAFAHAHVVFGHHGAEIGGNSIFVHPKAVIIEVTSMYPRDAGMGNPYFSTTRVIRCKAAYSVSSPHCLHSYFHDRSCLLRVNESLVNSALSQAARLKGLE